MANPDPQQPFRIAFNWPMTFAAVAAGATPAQQNIINPGEGVRTVVTAIGARYTGPWSFQLFPSDFTGGMFQGPTDFQALQTFPGALYVLPQPLVISGSMQIGVSVTNDHSVTQSIVMAFKGWRVYLGRVCTQG